MIQRIQMENVSKSFKEKQVLEQVNMELEAGRIVGLVGKNGSGKMVLMKLLCGFLFPDQGEIRVDGKRVGKEVDFPPNTGVILEKPSFISWFSGIRNLQELAAINRRVSRDQLEAVLELLELDPKSRMPVRKYSLGMKQRLGIAQAIMEDPDLLVLDEPMNSLDKRGVEVVRNILLDFREKGKIILLASHDERDIESLCDQVYEIEDKSVREVM